MQLKNGQTILFLCDRKACEGGCPHEACTHTGDIRHAKNFESFAVGENMVDYFEVEEVKKSALVG